MIGSGVVDRFFPDLLIFTTDKHFIGHAYVNKIIYRPLKSIHFENSVVQFMKTRYFSKGFVKVPCFHKLKIMQTLNTVLKPNDFGMNIIITKTAFPNCLKASLLHAIWS